jgi:hypothetical protein
MRRNRFLVAVPARTLFVSKGIDITRASPPPMSTDFAPRPKRAHRLPGSSHSPGSRTSYENVAGQGVTARGSLRKPRPDRIPARARLTAHRKSACWALRRLDGPTTNLRYQSRGLRSKRTDTADDQSRQCHLPQRLHTPKSPQVSARRVRPARWRGPELPGVFRADSAPPDPDYAFPQLTGLRPKALGIAKTTPFRYPH